MPLRNDQVRALLEAVEGTREVELDCEGFLDRMAGYAELRAAGAEVPVEEWRLVMEHEALCANCREECTALMEALRVAGQAGR